MAREPLGEVRLLHRDEQVCVWLKPPGLPTTSPDGGDCLVARVRRTDRSAAALHPLSRIDAMVSGLVAFARTREANHAAMEARRHGRFSRCYVALSSSAPEPGEGQWSWSIAIHGRDRRLRRALEPGESAPDARHALTHYAVSGQGSGLSALRLWPHTGRTHQLRVHAARAGCPLLGDVAYGAPKRVTLSSGAVLSARRVQLHCAWLRIPDAAQPGGWLELSADPLPDMAALWESAGGELAALAGAREPG